MKKSFRYLALIFLFTASACKKKSTTPDSAPAPKNISNTTAAINNVVVSNIQYNINTAPAVKFSFTGPVSAASVNGAVTFTEISGGAVAVSAQLTNGDSSITITPTTALKNITKYNVSISTGLRSASGGALTAAADVTFITKIDSTLKFPLITDAELLTKVQQQTFKYFWDFGHPVSGLARERNSSGEIVTSGGSGFGIMAIPVAINRSFITRAQGLQRMQTMVTFLKNTAQKFHGAFPHWLNGSTGVVVPFSTKDNGADLVETSYLIAGLLCARQYFNDAGAAETTLRNDINSICDAVEWNWFRQGNQNVLYWHWSPNFGWDMNLPIRGWNECLITYVLAASSTTYGVPAAVYTNGWKGSTGFANGNSYYGYQLPLGSANGGPLFFSHYSFLGINPNGLNEAGVNYFTQVKNHTLINYNYCKANPKNYFGYSGANWGLTASDIQNGYTASSPSNDVGVIAPTAALSSFPYTPAESMDALKFFYYTLGDKIWSDYGFTDAFNLHTQWFANSTLAIDQGPIIIMIENYRSQSIWNLLTSCPEIKNGMKNVLGFTAPYL